MDREHRYNVWKDEVAPRLVEPSDADMGFALDDFPEGRANLVSEWRLADGSTAIVARSRALIPSGVIRAHWRRARHLSFDYATCSIPSGSPTHECRRSSQTDLVGAGKDGSANAPTGMATTPGDASVV